jgi:hypothetical protein
MTDRSDLLASCLNAIESGESTIEDCIKAHPEITGLLRMAVALRAQPEMKMAEAPKLSLERRLTRLMDERPRSGAPARSWHWLRVFASLAALFVVVFGLGAGLAQLARPAIPGDVLYAYKRVVERVELGFASSAAQSEVLTYIAGQRLNELKLLALRGQPLDESLLADLKDSLNAALAAQSSPQARFDLYTTYRRELASAAEISAVNAAALRAAMDSITKPSSDSASAATSTAVPGPTVTPSATPSPSYTPSTLPTLTYTLSPTLTPTPTGTPGPTLTPSLTPEQPVIGPSVRPSDTPYVPPTAQPTTIILPSPTPQPTVTLTPLILPSPTPVLQSTVMLPFISPTSTPQSTVLAGPTVTPTTTPTVTYTVTPQGTATSTPTPTATSTLRPCGPPPTAGPTLPGGTTVDPFGNTLTPTHTAVPCASWTPSPTGTPSETATVTPTATPSATVTHTPSSTALPTENTPVGTAEAP